MENKKKYHHYVLVFTVNGPKYVTSVNNANREASWEENKAPYEMSYSNAEQLAIGLTWNGYHAVVVKMNYEIKTNPYNYVDYEMIFKEKENK